MDLITKDKIVFGLAAVCREEAVVFDATQACEWRTRLIRMGWVQSGALTS
jgi:hypothetical protein